MHYNKLKARRLASFQLQTVKKPSGRFGGPQPSEGYSESSDMCGGFGSLAQQGFLARFPGRAEGAGETCFGGKGRRRRTFSTACKLKARRLASFQLVEKPGLAGFYSRAKASFIAG